MQTDLEKIVEFFGSNFITFSKNDDLQTKTMKCDLFIRNEYRKKFGKDFSHNNYWRAYFQRIQLIEIFNLQEEIILDPNGTTGPDFLSEELGVLKGEFKGEFLRTKFLTHNSLGKISFDKQNDSIRRKAIYEYDSLMYSVFKRTGDIVFSVIIVGPDKMKLIHPLMEEAQSEKLVEIRMCEDANKRLSRDDIKIKALELICLLKNQDMTIIYKGEKMNKEDFLLRIGWKSEQKLLYD